MHYEVEIDTMSRWRRIPHPNYKKPVQNHTTNIEWDIIQEDPNWPRYTAVVRWIDGEELWRSQPKGSRVEAERSARSMARQYRKGANKAKKRILDAVNAGRST